MENVTDALYIAGAMLLFLFALSVAMFSVTSLREGADAFFSQSETIALAKGTEGYINFMESKDKGAVRIVGSETIMSSMYRAIKENFVVYLKLKDYSDQLRHMDDLTISEATKDIKVNGHDAITSGDEVIQVTIGEDKNQRVISIFSKGLYSEIKDLKFYEYIGEYQEQAEGVSSENKQIKRIITYVEKLD